MERLLLEWDKHKLEGFQPAVYGPVVSSIAESISNGKSLPSVYVVRKDSSTYQILDGIMFPDSPWRAIHRMIPLKSVFETLFPSYDVLTSDFLDYNDGGHHRAVAHRMMQEPLPCKVFEEHWDVLACDSDFFPIEDVRIESNISYFR